MKQPMMAKFLGWVFDQVMTGPLNRFEEATSRPFATQEAGLKKILRANAGTEFGREHKFASMSDSASNNLWRAFRSQVPIRSYNDFLPQIERMKKGEENILIPGKPSMFSLTSGTTSSPKFCPINRSFIKEHHRQHLIWMYHVFMHHPLVNQGKYLVMASPAEMGLTEGGIPYGAMSGKQLDVQSVPVRRRQAVPSRVQHLPDAEDRWFNTLLFALAEKHIRVVTSVNPSTLVAMAERLSRNAEALIEYIGKGHPAAGKSDAPPVMKMLASRFRPNPARARELREILQCDGGLSPATVWPEIEMLLTWQGGSSSFYLPHVAALWGNTAQRCLGLRASEGTFSIPLRDHSPSGVLAVGGHVMEFVPEGERDSDPWAETLLPGQLEKGKLYRLIATTSGGFYRYDMGDLVRVTGFMKRTPVVAFERRAGSVLSATGEKLTEDQVVAAIGVAAAEGPLLNGFTLTWEMNGEGGVRYVLALEPVGGKGARHHRNRQRDRIRQLLSVFDHELISRNCEYKSKRDDGRLGEPRAVILAEGSYERYREKLAKEGKPENQIKQPVMVAPPGAGRMPVKGCPVFDCMEIVEEL